MGSASYNSLFLFNKKVNLYKKIFIKINLLPYIIFIMF